MQCIKYYIRKSSFHAESVLKNTLYDYFKQRRLPNIKFLALNDTVYLLQYLGCDLERGDIIVYVKLSLRLKMLLKSTPQCIPIKQDQQYDEWYNLFLTHLKYQVKEIFNKLLDANETPNETEMKVRNHILKDKVVIKKYLCDIEREIIQLTSDTQPNSTDKDTNESNNEKQNTEVTETENMNTEESSVNQSENQNSKDSSTLTINQIISQVVSDELMNSNQNETTDNIQIEQVTSLAENPEETSAIVQPTEPTEPPLTISISNVVSLQTETDTTEKSQTDNNDGDDDLMIIENELDVTANTNSSNSVVQNVKNQNILEKARNMNYSFGRSPILSSFFRRYCESNGTATIPVRANLIKVVKELNLSMNFNKNLEIYTIVAVELCRYYLSNLQEFHEFDFERLVNDQELYQQKLIDFKSVLRYVLQMGLYNKLPNKLNELQKRLPQNIPLASEELDNIVLTVTAPTEKLFKNLTFINQFNITEFKNVVPQPHTGLTTRQIYNFPGVSIKCKFANIEFGRVNEFDYNSFIILKQRKNINQYLINRRIIGEQLIKTQNDAHGKEDEQEYALSTKCLVTYFRDVIVRLQQKKINGVKSIRDICSEFLNDVDYVSPNRKSLIMNHEVHCCLSSYKYSVTAMVNHNQTCLTHYINPEVKIFLAEVTGAADECSVILKCTKCEISYDLFDNNDNMVKFFSQHLIDQHGYFISMHECVKCEKQHSFQELLNKRWAHECN